MAMFSTPIVVASVAAESASAAAPPLHAVTAATDVAMTKTILEYDLKDSFIVLGRWYLLIRERTLLSLLLLIRLCLLR